MSGKKLTPKEIAMARHEMEVWNSQLARGLIDPSQFVRTQYVVCGCGAEGCGFITRWMKNAPNVLDLQEQKRLYEQYLLEHQKERSS